MESTRRTESWISKRNMEKNVDKRVRVFVAQVGLIARDISNKVMKTIYIILTSQMGKLLLLML